MKINIGKHPVVVIFVARYQSDSSFVLDLSLAKPWLASVLSFLPFVPFHHYDKGLSPR
jgi:hypothetical protein